MAGKMYTVKAVWDEEAKVFYSESDIIGLHVEAESLGEFEEILNELVGELIVTNHITADEFAQKKLGDLIPSVRWEIPGYDTAVA